MFGQLLINEFLKVYFRQRLLLFFAVLSGFLCIAVTMTYFISRRIGEFPSVLQVAGIAEGMMSTAMLLFGIVAATATVTGEFRDGTVKLLLIRPVPRVTVLLSKWVNMLLIVTVGYLVLTVLSYGLSLLVFQETQSILASLAILIKRVFYQLPSHFFYVTLAMFIAVLSKSTSLSLIVPIVINVFGGVVVQLLASYTWIKYVIFANLQLAVYDADPAVSGGLRPILEEMTLGYSLAVIVFYCAAMLAWALLDFRSRDVV